MTQINFTGGARIGMASATWPFASLKVSSEQLDLNSAIAGNLVFKPGDITSIEPYFSIPLLGQGIRINHRIPAYKEKVIFWTFKDPNEVIRQIQQTGFFDNSVSREKQSYSDVIAENQKQGGFPVKLPFAIGIVVIWNILILMDFLNFFKSGSESAPLSNGAIAALGIVFLSCLLILISRDFRKIVLKKGRDLKDISRFLYFLMFISGVMLFALLALTK